MYENWESELCKEYRQLCKRIEDVEKSMLAVPTEQAMDDKYVEWVFRQLKAMHKYKFYLFRRLCHFGINPFR